MNINGKTQLKKKIRELCNDLLSNDIFKKSTSESDKIMRGFNKELLNISELCNKLCEYEHYDNNMLDLSKNEMTSGTINVLSLALETNDYIEKIDLEYNDIGDEGCEFLVRLLKSDNFFLEGLYLKKNNITKKGIIYICEGLKSNKKLRYLDISYNNIIYDNDNDTTSEHIGVMLSSNESIEYLNMNNTNLETSKELINGIMKNKSLKFLEMKHNEYISLKGIIDVLNKKQYNLDGEILNQFDKICLTGNDIGIFGVENINDFHNKINNKIIEYKDAYTSGGRWVLHIDEDYLEIIGDSYDEYEDYDDDVENAHFVK